MSEFYITYSQTQIQQKPSTQFQSTEIEEDVIWQKASAKFKQFTLSWSHYHVTIYDTEQVTEQVTASTEHVTEHVTKHVARLIYILENELSRPDLMKLMQINHRPHFIYEYLQPALEKGLIEMTIPDKPKSILQKYRLTEEGKAFKEKFGRIKG